MILSIPFLVATLLVYALIKELRATLNGKSLMCYVLGLIVAYTFLATVQLNGDNRINDGLCKFLGFTIYFALMFSFFWLNVISFDIWWTFGYVQFYIKLFKFNIKN